MSIDINIVVQDMITEIKSTIKTNWKNVKDTAITYVETNKDRLAVLATLRIEGKIDEEFFQARLSEEKKILESQLLSLKIVTAAIAQKAANAALEVLSKAIATAIKMV